MKCALLHAPLERESQAKKTGRTRLDYSLIDVLAYLKIKSRGEPQGSERQHLMVFIKQRDSWNQEIWSCLVPGESAPRSGRAGE